MPVPSRILVPILALLTAACGSGGDARFDVLLIGDPAEALEDKVPLPAAAGLIREATGSGLVALDAQGRIQPDLAARWIVTDDGLSYIFRFESFDPDEKDPLTADDVRKALQARIRQFKNTGLGLDLRIIDGIYARTDEVVEIQLKSAMPEFLQLLARPELALRFEGRDTGALTLSADGPVLTLSRPAGPDGRVAASLDVRISSARDAVRRFQAGEAELLLDGGLDALPHVELGGLLRGTIRLDPITGIFGLSIAKNDGFLSRAANREAISLAIDRQALIAPFNIGGWTPRVRLVPVGMPGTAQPPGPWDGYTMEQRQAFAAQRVAGWAATKGPIPPITIALPPGSGGDILFRRLSADFSNVGLAAKRVGPDADAQLRLVEDVAWLDQPEWYLHRFDCAVINGVCSAEADKLVGESIGEPDMAKRAALLSEAERLLTAETTFISFGPPIRFSLVRGGVDGFAVNRWGFHPLSQLFATPN
ncbi:peptide ABC transporter substrate-binding protein [Croceicoccus ponticola]|uniref:Peptide ABC transporter substrate-binding protein n=1 Tax=Croceicoccus ponticola TaxID=2217664 RepID=A0A437H2B0_9SPHN|nr:peptide ABC transporter substrate-binding protein [Croceicoccus ponticola]RVQ69686.1 peptide ABC transporter substrate-binding protein [Croceicoccus ponticola]